MYLILSSPRSAKEVAHTIKVEAKRETHGLVKRIGLSGTEGIGRINGENTHLETGTKSKVFTIPLFSDS